MAGELASKLGDGPGPDCFDYLEGLAYMVPPHCCVGAFEWRQAATSSKHGGIPRDSAIYVTQLSIRRLAPCILILQGERCRRQGPEPTKRTKRGGSPRAF